MFKSQLESSKADNKRDLAELKFQIANIYFNLYKAIESKKLLDENLKTVDARITDIKNFNIVGMALDNDVLKAELLKSNIEISKSEIENIIATLSYNMNILMGLPENQELILNDNDLLNSTNITADATFQPSDRSELISAKWKMEALNSSLKISKSAYFPIISAGINYYYNNPNQRKFPLENKFLNTWDAGISLNWSITQLFTAKENIKESKNNLMMAKLAMQQINDGIKSEVFGNQKSYLLQQKKLNLSEKALQQATENSRIMKNRFDNQISLFSDLIDADTQKMQAQINLLQAKCDAMLAYYKYMRSIEK
jgi:outer membrane protein TolC